MKISSVLFGVFGVFYLAAGVVYLSYAQEAAGFTLLIVLVLFVITLAGYVYIRFRALPEPLPEDRADADMADGEGQVMYFPSSSVWPLALAASVSAAGLGLIVGLWWTAGGMALFAVGVAGYVRESNLAVSRHPDPGTDRRD